MKDLRVRVAVVDDDDAVGQMIEEACEIQGLSCIVTRDADAFRQSLDDSIRGVLIDLVLPGTDGIEILRQLAERRFSGPIVLLSGVDGRVLKAAAEMAQSRGLNIVGRLEKPFELATLFDLLRLIKDHAPSDQAVAARDELSDTEVHNALTQNLLEIYYQPQISLKTGSLHGVEALVRMRHPALGIVNPAAFLPIVQRCGWMESLTAFVVSQALKEFSLFQAPLKLSVNVAAHSLLDLSLPDRLSSLVEQYSFPPEQLVIEVTETGLVGELGKTLDTLSRLRLKGFGISVDDFGTGYSSLAQLKTLPATELKIDRVFVKDVTEDKSSRSMVAQTILLAHELGLVVVAEGNETAAQTDILRSLDCDLAQGFYFSKPLDFSGLQAWMKTLIDTKS